MRERKMVWSRLEAAIALAGEYQQVYSTFYKRYLLASIADREAIRSAMKTAYERWHVQLRICHDIKEQYKGLAAKKAVAI